MLKANKTYRLGVTSSPAGKSELDILKEKLAKAEAALATKPATIPTQEVESASLVIKVGGQSQTINLIPSAKSKRGTWQYFSPEKPNSFVPSWGKFPIASGKPATTPKPTKK